MEDEKKELPIPVLEKFNKQPKYSLFDNEDSLVIEEVLKKRALDSARGQIHDMPRWAEK